MTNCSSNRKKNLKYYECLSVSCVGPSRHFKRIIEMDVKRTDEANKDPVHYQQLTNILLNFSK
jgi:hypothetical protein